MDEVLLLRIIAICVILILAGVINCALQIKKANKKTISEIEDMQSFLKNGFNDTKSVLNTSKGEIIKFISSGNKSIVEYISKQNDIVKQLVGDEFSNLTATFVKEVESSRKLLARLTDIVLSFQAHTNKVINEHSDKLEIISDSVKSLIIDEQQLSKSIHANVNEVINVISEFSKTMERQIKMLDETDKSNIKRIDASISSLSSSVKNQGDEIISICRQNISIEKEFQQSTKGSLDIMNEQLTKYLPQLKQIDKMYENLQNLYNKLLDEEVNFVKQESSISTMIEKHANILELTSEMNNISKEIFEFMKLYLIQSTLDNIDNNRRDRYIK